MSILIDNAVLTAINPYFESLMRLYSAGRVTAAQVHSAVGRVGWNISYADFYAIVSTRQPDVAKQMLKADVVAGNITPAQYEQITGEVYVA